MITAVSGGTATITITTEDGNKTAQCIVTVYVHAGEYLVDVVDIGTYINGGEVNGGNWRVLSKSESGADGVVKLVSANTPFTLYHPRDGKSGETIVALQNLTEEYPSWKNINYVDNSKGCHAFGCSIHRGTNSGSKATAYSPLNEIETLYQEITGISKTMNDFYMNDSNLLLDSGLQTVAGSRWKSIYAGLLYNGSFYWLGGASWDTSYLWYVYANGMTYHNCDYTAGVRPVVYLQAGVKVSDTNMFDGTGADKAYTLTK